jgi:hypothetical protein
MAACLGALVLCFAAAPANGYDVEQPKTLIPGGAFRYAVPTAMDWNGDGKWDLVVGTWENAGSGSLRLYLNKGTNAAPNLAFDSFVSAGGSQINVGYG